MKWNRETTVRQKLATGTLFFAIWAALGAMALFIPLGQQVHDLSGDPVN